MSKNDQYFPHDYNAFHDLKVVAFISECGLAGYGFYWVVIERLHKEENCQLPKKNYVYKGLAEQMSTSVEQIKSYVEQATDNELFVENDEYIISDRVLKNMKKRQDISDKRSEAGKISALKRTSVKQVLTSVEQNSTKEKKGKEIKEIKDIKKNTKEKPPLPPDTEIQDYFFQVISDQVKILNKTIEDVDKEKALIDFNKCLTFCKDKHKTTRKKSYNWKNQVNKWVDITKYRNFKKVESDPEITCAGWDDMVKTLKQIEPKCLSGKIYNELKHKSDQGYYSKKKFSDIWKIAVSMARNYEYQEV